MTSTVELTGTWTADTVHSDVSFKVRHMAVGKAKGKFTLGSATLTVPAEGLEAATVVAEIDATSVNTGQEQRDGHVRSDDFLSVDKFPVLTFKSTGVKDFSAEEFVLVGDLTIRDVTKTVELTTEFLGATIDAYGNERVGFSAKTSISRKEYGVSFNAVFGTSNSVVSDKVEIDLELEFTKSA